MPKVVINHTKIETRSPWNTSADNALTTSKDWQQFATGIEGMDVATTGDAEQYLAQRSVLHDHRTGTQAAKVDATKIGGAFDIVTDIADNSR